jgi:response regulator RpfG family c-di-GMP phosphodiesterase
MIDAGAILLVAPDPDGARHQVDALRLEVGLRVVTARTMGEALEAARVEHPDLVLCPTVLPDGDGLSLAAALKANVTIDGALCLVIGAPTEADLDRFESVDAFLPPPVSAPELRAKVRAMLRLKRVYDQLRDDKLELERLHRAVGERFEQLLSLLVHLLDLSVAGAADRGAQNARLAARLAERFEVPTALRRDLDIAIRLHEIGKLVLAADPEQPEATEAEEAEDVLEGDSWRYAIAARDLLRQTDGLGPAAELIGSMFENWDGTGHPERLRQGQIPLRCRFIRVLSDFQIGIERWGSPVAAVERLALHAGTRYDPLVVAHLDAEVRALEVGPDPLGRVRVRVADLQEGMVLADDLWTSSGVKLLSAGAELSSHSLDVIRRRHRSDPIVHGAWVRRTSGAPGS